MASISEMKLDPVGPGGIGKSISSDGINLFGWCQSVSISVESKYSLYDPVEKPILFFLCCTTLCSIKDERIFVPCEAVSSHYQLASDLVVSLESYSR